MSRMNQNRSRGEQLFQRNAGFERSRRRAVLVAAVLLLCAVLLVLALHVANIFTQPQGQPADESGTAKEDWELLLVNRWHPVPDGYEIEFTRLSNGESVDSRIYPALQQMFDDMRAQGVYPVVGTGYRSRENQEELMAERIEAYEAEGYSHSRAEKLAEEWVAKPGTSEHELGIAVDINADKSRSKNEEVYQWLAKNAYRYGFILRYPQDKEEVTGTAYEPWHYRYVGVENAKKIRESGLCLEEYLEK